MDKSRALDDREGLNMTTTQVYKLREACKLSSNVTDDGLAMLLIDALTLLLNFMYKKETES